MPDSENNTTATPKRKRLSSSNTKSSESATTPARLFARQLYDTGILYDIIVRLTVSRHRGITEHAVWRWVHQWGRADVMAGKIPPAKNNLEPIRDCQMPGMISITPLACATYQIRFRDSRGTELLQFEFKIRHCIGCPHAIEDWQAKIDARRRQRRHPILANIR